MRFKFLSKAQNIHNLSFLKLKFKVPQYIFFSYLQWKNDKKSILDDINKKFKNKYIIVRSSAIGEDTFKNSQAGKYLSINNVLVKKKSSLISKINKVFKSYKNSNALNEVIIQESIKKISMSGVIFTHEIENGAPYYAINYDDRTDFTDTVTAGNSEYSNRTLYIFRDQKKKIKSQRFKKLITCVKDLEKKIDSNYLDIEFGLTKKLECYLFQVRPITKIKHKKNNINHKFNKSFKRISKKILNITDQNKKSNFKTIFAQMPDWNPAEMIGKISKPLAISLYETLITDNVWSDARSELGYFKPKNNKLMENFFYQPFINVKLSFQSFTPASIPNNLRNKLVNYWLEVLRQKPFLHDKVEFDIALTCYFLGFNKKLRKLLPTNLLKRETDLIIKEYRNLTNSIFKKFNKDLSFQELSEISNLNKLQEKNFDQKLKNFDLKKEVELCKEFGTMPFAKLARYAFVAETFLISLREKKILKQVDIDKFLFSIETVASELANDLDKHQNKKLSSYSFLKKYGHLRPGTYDIGSKSYDELELFNKKLIFKKKNRENKKEIFLFNQKILNKIDTSLKKEFININSNQLILFIKESIKAREFSKFIFSKSISNILKYIIILFRKYKIRRNDLAYLKLKDIFKFLINKNIKTIKKTINYNKNKFKTESLIKLPLIFSNLSSLEIVPFQISTPNFITNKKILGQVVKIESSININIKKIISGKIVLIEGADPGYDWIFSFDIKALITKFGGANSHMSIRCSEFGLPAAIGCGEQIFHKIENSNTVLIDCESKKIEIVN